LFDLGRTAHVVTPFADTLDSMVSAAHACTEAGLITICAYPSYKRADRTRLRSALRDERFIEVFVDTPLALCKERRPDADFSGFEPPETPDLHVKLEDQRMFQAIDAIVDVLEQHGQFDER
jgi:adenylylsulfate kinase-like enzyme